MQNAQQNYQLKIERLENEQQIFASNMAFHYTQKLLEKDTLLASRAAENDQ